MFLLKKLIRLLEVQMMIKEYNQSIQYKHFEQERIKIYYVTKKKLNVTIKQLKKKMINFDDITKENMKKYNLNWQQIPDYPYRTINNYN